MTDNLNFCEHNYYIDHIDWGPLVDGLPEGWQRIVYADGCVLEPRGAELPAKEA